MNSDPDSSDAAFEHAVTGYDLFGERLRPYSQSRKDAAELMGLQYPFLSDEDATRARKTNRWPSIKKDTAIVLWLCGIKDADDQTDEDRKAVAWCPELAFMHPTRATVAAMDWINSKPWADTKTAEFQVAAAVMCSIVLDTDLSAFTVAVDGGGDAKKKETSSPSPTGVKSPPASSESPDTV